jgi:protein-disulfide isomerase
MQVKKNASCVIAIVLPLLLGLCLPGAASAQAAATEPSKSEDDALLQRLEQSGALDQAVERAIQRLTRRQMEAQQKAQDEALARSRELAKNARPVDPAHDHVQGDARAPISIIEYSDFECPFCKRFHGVPEEVVKRLGGKVNFVWRQFPLEMHGPAAMRAAEASECAARQGGNDSFWTYADEVMKRTRSNGQGLPAGDGDPLVALAAELKLDAAAFGKCLDSGETRQRVGEDMKDGEGAGVTGTPGIVLRNAASGKSTLIEGAIPAEALESAVRELLPAQ